MYRLMLLTRLTQGKELTLKLKKRFKITQTSHQKAGAIVFGKMEMEEGKHLGNVKREGQRGGGDQ